MTPAAAGFEKPMDQDADSVPIGGRPHDDHANAIGLIGPA